MKKVLIIGASSFIGKSLSSYLEESGFNVFTISREPLTKEKHFTASFGDDLNKHILEEDFDYIFHLAHDYTSASNTTSGTKKWVEQLSKPKTKQVFASSPAANNPYSQYGRIKKELESYFLEHEQFVMRLPFILGSNTNLAPLEKTLTNIANRVLLIPLLFNNDLQIPTLPIDDLNEKIISLIKEQAYNDKINQIEYSQLNSLKDLIQTDSNNVIFLKINPTLSYFLIRFLTILPFDFYLKDRVLGLVFNNLDLQGENLKNKIKL